MSKTTTYRWLIHDRPATTRKAKRRVGPGAARKQRERQAQLEGELAKQRRQRIGRALSGELKGPSDRAHGERVERLDDIAPSRRGKAVFDFEVPGARRDKAVEKRDMPRRVSMRNVIDAPTTVDGRLVESDQGGDVLAHDVRRLAD